MDVFDEWRPDCGLEFPFSFFFFRPDNEPFSYFQFSSDWTTNYLYVTSAWSTSSGPFGNAGASGINTVSLQLFCFLFFYSS